MDGRSFANRNAKIADFCRFWQNLGGCNNRYRENLRNAIIVLCSRFWGIPSVSVLRFSGLSLRLSIPFRKDTGLTSFAFAHLWRFMQVCLFPVNIKPEDTRQIDINPALPNSNPNFAKGFFP